MDLIDFNKDVFWVTDTGLVRAENEDNCYVAETPNGFLFVVCDGMGGHAGGKEASTIAIESIVNFFTKEKHVVIYQALSDALVYANRQILNVAVERQELKGMGTTACILLLRDDKAWFAHIGDSRIYLFCNRQQKLHRLTKDHSVVQGLVDKGIISEAEAEHHPEKNKIIKTLGINKEIKPDICNMPVLPAKGDIFLICSDGLTGMVSDEVLQHILKQKESLQEKGANMLSLAKQAGGTDNITIQLVHVSNSPYKKSIFESKNSQAATAPVKYAKKLFSPFVIALVLSLFAFAAVLVYKNTMNTKQETVENPTPPKEKPVLCEDVVLKPGYEKAVQERGYKKVEANVGPIDPTLGIRMIFNRKGQFSDKKKFEGIIVYESDDYYVGNIMIYSDAKPYKVFREGGTIFDKNGQGDKTVKDSLP